MEKTKYVAFSTQKGGAGKTTLTVLVASYLHYVKGFNVAIIDCDHPQYSISGIRSRDAEASVKDAHYKKMAYEQIKKLNKKPYPVTKSKRFRKETAKERKAVFRYTVFPADKSLVRGSNLDKLVDEVLTIIKT